MMIKRELLIIGFFFSIATMQAQEQKNNIPESLYGTFSHLFPHDKTMLPYSKTGNFSLENRDTCSIFTGVFYLENDYQEIWIGSDNTYILDVETGDRYAARKALHGFKLGQVNIAKGHKGKNVAYQIEFPLLSRFVKKIKIYGMPQLGLNGEHDFCVEELTPMKIPPGEYKSEPLMSYDDHMPQIKAPEVVKPKKAYQNNDSTTYPVFRNLQKVYPLLEGDIKTHSVALYATQDATYFTKIIECKQPRTLVRIAPGLSFVCADIPEGLDYMSRLEFIRKNGKQIESFAPYPVDKTFVIEGTPGDFVVIVIKFAPLNLGAEKIAMEISESGTYSEYLEEAVHFFLSDEQLAFYRNNQKYIRLMPDNITKIIK